ncbi:MAG: DUF2325 domain-containing protein [Campylobacteraceae bacterium]|nr:DUF2325 domain-containing protein [Campylobacteraceae bacterium]
MSVLVIGGDKIDSIASVLQNFRVDKIIHWDGRNPSVVRKDIPQDVQLVIMLTNFLNHNAMNKFKNESKRKAIQFICAKRSESSVFCELCKKFNTTGGCLMEEMK